MKTIMITFLASLLLSGCADQNISSRDFEKLVEDMQCTQLDYNNLVDAIEGSFGLKSKNRELYDGLVELNQKIYKKCTTLIPVEFNECIPNLPSSENDLTYISEGMEYIGNPLKSFGIIASKDLSKNKVSMEVETATVDMTCLNGKFPPRLVFSNSFQGYSYNLYFVNRSLNHQEISLNLYYLNNGDYEPINLFFESESSKSIQNLQVDAQLLDSGLDLIQNTCDGLGVLLPGETCQVGLELNGTQSVGSIADSSLEISHDFIDGLPYFTTLIKILPKQVECLGESDCSSFEHCSYHSCNLDSGRCYGDSDCNDWEQCSSNTCELAPGRCASDGDCSSDEYCSSNRCYEEEDEEPTTNYYY